MLRLHYIVFLFTSSLLWATQDQTFGLGGKSTGRVSGMNADTDHPFGAIYNPALLGASPRSLFGFSTGVVATKFSPLNNVVIDSPEFRTRDAQDRSGNVELPSTQTAMWSVGLTHTFALPKYLDRKAGLGVVLSGPYQRLRTFSAGTPYDFASLRYGTSDAQFKGTVSGGVEILKDQLYFGAGLSLFITGAGAADARLVDDNPTGRLNLDVGLNTALVTGFYVPLQKENFRQQVSLVYRQAVEPSFQQKFEGTVQVARGTSTVGIPLVLRTTLYYEPHSLEADWQGVFSFGMKVSAGLSYQLWSGYRPSYLVLEAPTREGTTATTRVPQLSLANVVSPRVSAEIPFFDRNLALALGYQFRPSPLNDTSNEANLLDSSAHVTGASITWKIPDNDLLPLPVRLSAYGQYHFLLPRPVRKTSSQFIGAPGYEINGNSYSYGLMLEAAL